MELFVVGLVYRVATAVQCVDKGVVTQEICTEMTLMHPFVTLSFIVRLTVAGPGK